MSSFVDLKRPAIATLKCLGAPNGVVFRIYLIQILLLAGLGIAIGLARGGCSSLRREGALANLVPVSAIGIYPVELGFAVLYGLLVTLGFALGPLGRARQLPASSLFADRAVHAPLNPPLRYRLAQAAALLALAALAVRLAGDRGSRCSTSAPSSARSWCCGWSRSRSCRWRGGSARRGARRSGLRCGTSIGPGALTPSVVLSLGLGLTLLVSLALIDTNLRDQLSGTIAEKAPDFFFLDVQDQERDAFVQRLWAKRVPGARWRRCRCCADASSRSRACRRRELTGRRPPSWALRGDRGITYSETRCRRIPPLSAGEWWAPGYEGEPLVSLEREVAGDLGLSVGDTIGVNVLGRTITAKVANLRELDWDSLSINFVIGVLAEYAPRRAACASRNVCGCRRRSGAIAERDVLAAVTRDFPGRHHDQRSRCDRIGKRNCRRPRARRPRGSFARARRLHAGARAGRSPQATGSGGRMPSS